MHTVGAIRSPLNCCSLGCRFPMFPFCWDINQSKSLKSITPLGLRLAKTNSKPRFGLRSNDTILKHEQININETHACLTI